MKAELIAVGTEILTGQITNTNAQFLSEKLAELGIDVYFHTAVGDNENRLLSVLEQASKRSDLVILCGGLGPTEDDLTKQTLAKFLGKELVFDEEASKKLIVSLLLVLNTHERLIMNVKRKLLRGYPLQNPQVLQLRVITAQGVTYVVLPGPPSELKPMVNQELVPALTENHASLYSRVLRFFGVGESQLVTILKDFIVNQTDPTIAPYAKVGEVTLRLSTKASSREEADQKLDVLEEQIRSTKTLDGKSLSDFIYGYGESNSLALKLFVCLRTMARLSLQ
ncbi:MAG: molybdopterin-binding protein [Streptococcus sp.]